MNSELNKGRAGSIKSDDGANFELWTEETVDIETPFSNMNQDDIEYLKLEIAELKQILIALAEKYKLSEDRRKVAERRNSFLKADNLRLQQMSDTSLSQKIEAEIESRRTLDKLREFIDFKHEFEKQAELLKKIISHLPRMKNAATSTSNEMIEKSEQCSGDGFFSDILTSDEMSLRYNDPYYKHHDSELYRSLMIDSAGDSCKLENAVLKSDWTSPSANQTEDKFFEPSDSITLTPDGDKMEIDEKVVKDEPQNQVRQMAMTICDNLQNEKMSHATSIDYQADKDSDIRSWDPKSKKEMSNAAMNGGGIEIKSSKSKIKLSKLKQEVLALKNLNEWKSSDLEYKNRQLAIKNRELLHAKKEITQLKMRVNRLLIEQQKRPSTSCVSPSLIRLETKLKPDRTSNKKEGNKMKMSSSAVAEDCTRRRHPISETNVRGDSFKLPLSSESVWQEIAPGDSVRIKLRKQLLD